MCGLVGVAGNLGLKDEGLMRRMLLVNQMRGDDSTGLAAIRRNGDTAIVKTPGAPNDLYDMSKFKAALNGNTSCTFIGHGRAATRGAVTKQNAHPFQFDHIVGAHNGSLEWSAQTDLEKALDDKFGVDSAALYAAIAKFGVDETLAMTRGSWSLVWVDLNEGTLNFLRNRERPLWYGFTKDFKRLMWASEWPFIDFAMKTGGYGEESFVDKEGYRYFSTVEDTLYSWSLVELKDGKGERPKPKVREVRGKAPFFQGKGSGSVNQGNTYDPFNRRTTGNANVTDVRALLEERKKERRGKQTLSTTTSQSSSNDVRVIELTGTNDNPTAGIISRERFEEIASSGCTWCCEPIQWGTPGVTIYERQGKILCPKHSLKGPEHITRIIVPKTKLGK